MKSDTYLIREARQAYTHLGQYLESLSSLDGARNPSESKRYVDQAMLMGLLLMVNVEKLQERYAKRVAKKTGGAK